MFQCATVALPETYSFFIDSNILVETTRKGRTRIGVGGTRGATNFDVSIETSLQMSTKIVDSASALVRLVRVFKQRFDIRFDHRNLVGKVLSLN